MDSIEDIRRRIRNANDLHGVVRTMRTLAMTSIRQYERAVESLSDYYRATELGLHVVLSTALREGRALPPAPKKPSAERRTGILIFGSDQSMSGQFNENIAAWAAGQIAEMGIPHKLLRVVAFGARVQFPLEDWGFTIHEQRFMPGSVAGITPAVQNLLFSSDQWQASRSGGGIEQLFLFYNRLESAVAWRPTLLRLLPVNLHTLAHLDGQGWPSRSLPIFRMDWQPLFSALLREHLFAALFRAFAESLASENAARLVSMQAAERNIEERLDELQKLYNQQRQEGITNELLDIISGFELLKQKQR